MSIDKGGASRWLLSNAGARQRSRPSGLAQSPLFQKMSFSRRRFLGTAAGAAGMAFSSGLALPVSARAAAQASTTGPDDGPQHLPGGFANPTLPSGCPSEIVHFFGPGPQNENSAIWDFNGFIGVATGLVNGTGNTGGTSQSFTGVHVDMRFMSGLYGGLDGNLHRGSFVFI